jgi:hypothetical protein
MARPRIALLSNPKSTGNLAQLPRIRAFCAEHPDIFHYEVEKAEQVGTALRTIARVRPKMLVINGGDGTVQAALTEIHNGGHFGESPPPVAVLPSGKTNLIALDLGASGDPVHALAKLLEIAQADLSPHIVARELIALRCGPGEQKPVIGMFLGGAGLADTILYCREKIYPLRLVAIEETPASLLRAFFATLAGKLGHSRVRGVHFEESDEIRIEGESSKVILDGETFRAEIGRPILLKLAQPLSFVRIAA